MAVIGFWDSEFPGRDLVLAIGIRNTIHMKNYNERIISDGIKYFREHIDIYKKVLERCIIPLPEEMRMEERMRKVAPEIFAWTSTLYTFTETGKKVIPRIKRYEKTLDKMLKKQKIKQEELKRLDFYFERLGKAA